MEDLSKYINKDSILRAIQYKPISKQEWIIKFTDKLNEIIYEQDKMSYGRVGLELKRFAPFELKNLWEYCEDAKNFNARFWYMVNLKKGQGKKIFRKVKPKQKKLLR